jgi:hypothetical protein
VPRFLALLVELDSLASGIECWRDLSELEELVGERIEGKI